MAKFTDKLTHLLNSQLPNFVLEDHPKFVQFLKSYYTFMESAELTLTDIQTTDGIQLETETNQQNELILDGSRIDTDRTQLDAGDKILLESSSFGKFTRGETVTGQTSNATATILTEDLDNNRLFISAQNKFEEGEIIIGSSSAASATVNLYRPNPVQNIQQLLDYRDPDKAISNFLTKFRNEFLNTIPENLNENIDRRSLIKNIKSLYRLKGTSQGHQIFFRLLFGLESETTYPREQVLRVSDGKWNTSKILRAIGTIGNTSHLIGRSISGQTSGATALVENVFKFQIGSDEVSEFVLNADSISGTFQVGEEIRATSSDASDTFIKATITGLPDNATLTNDGNLYAIGDTVSITSGGQGAIIQVNAIGRGGISEILIDDVGSGYEIEDEIVFDNSGTGGGNARAKVSVVNGGFTQEESTSTVDDHIVLEDETTRGDPYSGNKIVQETGSGDITDVRILSNGSNYSTLPTLTITSSGGSGARLLAYGTEIGRILDLKTIESGKGYQNSPTPPTLTLPVNVLFKDISGNFSINEEISGLGDDGSTTITGTITSIDTSKNILKIGGTTGTFGTDVTLTGTTSGAECVTLKLDRATASTTVVSQLDTAGTYINQDGHISESTMRIQDSLLYQDFSYVVKVGRSIVDWRDSFKSTMHSAGFYFIGQVDIETRLNAQLQNVSTVNSGAEGSPIQDVLNTLFTTLFGRRLGTETDGTTLSSNPQLGVGVVPGDSTITQLGAGERDVTLTQKVTLKLPDYKEVTTYRNNSTRFGVGVTGPMFKTLNKHLLGTNFGNQIRIEQLADLSLESTKNTSLYSITPTFDDYKQRIKINFAIPSEIGEKDNNSFDETNITFDTDSYKFDVA
jgi:hypothetical protein